MPTARDRAVLLS
uniref:Uncharacterized protein n=1 Tax=Arundo donax TaxID=35708 RepID=A0A0A9B3F1_ARUDO